MGEEHPEARGTTCHQCAALAEELAQARAELAAAKAELAKQALRYVTDPAFGMECVVNAERYAALRNAAMYDRVCDAWDFELNRMPDSAKLDDLADALIAAATTAPTVETAPEVTP